MFFSISSFCQEMNHLSFLSSICISCSPCIKTKHPQFLVFTLRFILFNTTFLPLDSDVTDEKSKIKNKQSRTEDEGAERRRRPGGVSASLAECSVNGPARQPDASRQRNREVTGCRAPQATHAGELKEQRIFVATAEYLDVTGCISSPFRADKLTNTTALMWSESASSLLWLFVFFNL